MGKWYLFYLFLLLRFAPAQDPTLLQAFYWDVPAGGIWWDSLASKAGDLGQYGLDMVWFPSPFKGSGGSYDMGYGIYDHFDAGEFYQNGTTETRFGSRTELQSAISAFHTAGVEVVCDIVINHTLGGDLEANSALHTYVQSDQYPVFPYSGYMYVLAAAPAGNYYFKIRGTAYDYTETGQDDRVGYYAVRPWFTHSSGLNAEGQPHHYEWNIGDGDCGPFDAFEIDLPGRIMEGNISSVGDVDEFYIAHTGGWLELKIWSTDGGGERDFKIYEIYRDAENVTDDILIHSYTSTTPASGRFAKNAAHFHPNAVHNDILPDYHYPYFGNDVCFYSGGAGDSLKTWGAWLTNTLGFDGYRFDVAKGIDPYFVAEWLNHPAMQNRYAVGEHWSDAGAISYWVNTVNNNLTGDKTMTGFDFPLRYALKDMCDNPAYDVRNLHSAGLYNSGLNGAYVTTFVNNHDVWRPYSSSHDPIINDLILAYAFIMTNPGTATLFWPDYYGGTFYNSDSSESFTMSGLKPQIDRLLEIRHAFVSGTFHKLTESGSPAYKHGDYPYGGDYSGAESKLYISQREGGVGAGSLGGSILVINTHSTDALGAWVTVQNTVGASLLEDYTGNRSGQQEVYGDNRVFVHAGPRSYAIWAKAGQDISLPVDLLSFGLAAEGKCVVLRWKTASETNHAWFDVERRDDRNGVFHKLNNKPIFARGGSAEQEYIFTDSTLNRSGLYFYRLADVALDGKRTIHPEQAIKVNLDQIPDESILLQIYPNPFNPATTLRFYLPEAGQPELSIFDIRGRLVYRFEPENLQKGFHTLSWNGINTEGKLVSAGVYLVRLKAGQTHKIKKMIFLK